jgi:pyridoxal phosphate enzyme (YggS family)
MKEKVSPMIADNVAALLRELPPCVTLEAAVKTRTAEEIAEALGAGVKIIGENYVQETDDHVKGLGNTGAKTEWHLIGHMQSNKARRAAELFQMVETIDSVNNGKALDRACARLNKVMPVLIEVNSGREPQKDGAMPESVETLVKDLSALKNIRVMGLMTMGPELHNPEELRPYFRETKAVFDCIAVLKVPNVEMKILSMGMTDSYKIAIEEGATLVRIGIKIFGARRV